jgi:hypothetical protein
MIFRFDATRQQLIQKKCDHGITRLGGFQLSNGGMAYQGGTVADDWSTADIMIEAEQWHRLISKPNGFRSKRSQRRRFISSYGNDLAQSYRLYTLALVST